MLQRRGVMPRFALFQCQKCGHTFNVAIGGDCIDLEAESEPEEISRCPECGSFNIQRWYNRHLKS
jgi:rubredoxin